MTAKLTVGDHVGWANPELENSCTVCGRKVGKNAWYVELNIDGQIMVDGVVINDSPSQGCWQVGSECAKKFDQSVLIKMEAN